MSPHVPKKSANMVLCNKRMEHMPEYNISASELAIRQKCLAANFKCIGSLAIRALMDMGVGLYSVNKKQGRK